MCTVQIVKTLVFECKRTSISHHCKNEPSSSSYGSTTSSNGCCTTLGNDQTTKATGNTGTCGVIDGSQDEPTTSEGTITDPERMETLIRLPTVLQHHTRTFSRHGKRRKRPCFFSPKEYEENRTTTNNPSVSIRRHRKWRRRPSRKVCLRID